MSEIKFTELTSPEERFVKWAICEIVARNNLEQEQLTKVVQQPMQVKLFFNGVELDFLGTLERLHSELDRTTKLEAESIIAAKFNGINEQLHELADMIREIKFDFLAKVRSKLELPPQEDEH